MAKKKKKTTGNFKAGTWVERKLFTSRAFLSLKGFAPQLLILFLGKRDMTKKGECKNKNNLTMTYIELENIISRYEEKKPWASNSSPKGISAGKTSRAFDELLAKGFIEIRSHGGAFQQDKTIFALSDNWRFWHEGLVFSERPKDTIKRGYRDPKKKTTRINGAIHTRINGA